MQNSMEHAAIIRRMTEEFDEVILKHCEFMKISVNRFMYTYHKTEQELN